MRRICNLSFALLAALLLTGAAHADGGKCNGFSSCDDNSTTTNEGGEGGDASAGALSVSDQDQLQAQAQGQQQGIFGSGNSVIESGAIEGGEGGDASAGALSGATSSSDSDVSFSNVDVDVIDADNGDGIAEAGRQLRKAAERHAESAADVRGSSAAAESPCGDTTGVSAQTGVAGGALSTVSETCRAYRLQILQAQSPDSMSTKLAAVVHYVGFLPRLILHVGSLGVLN